MVSIPKRSRWGIFIIFLLMNSWVTPAHFSRINVFNVASFQWGYFLTCCLTGSQQFSITDKSDCWIQEAEISKRYFELHHQLITVVTGHRFIVVAASLIRSLSRVCWYRRRRGRNRWGYDRRRRRQIRLFWYIDAYLIVNHSLLKIVAICVDGLWYRQRWRWIGCVYGHQCSATQKNKVRRYESNLSRSRLTHRISGSKLSIINVGSTRNRRAGVVLSNCIAASFS